MSVKVPTNFEARPNVRDGLYVHKEEIHYDIRNFTNTDLLIKRNAFHGVLKGIPIGDQDNNCIVIAVSSRFGLWDNQFFEPETPLDALILDKMKSAMQSHLTDGSYELREGILGFTFEIGIARSNLPEFRGADGGVHSRLLGLSLYGFDTWGESDLRTPPPYTNREVCDERGNKISTNPKTQIVYEYINNTDPDLVLYAPIGKEVVKLVAKQDPGTKNEMRISIKSGGSGKVRTIKQALPEFSGNQEEFFKALDNYGYYLSHSDAAKSVNSKSLQHAQSKVKELTKEIDSLNTKLVKLEDSKGKLKEANSKQQLKQEQTSIWSKMFETIIKVPFNIIASLLERKLTSLVAARLFAALI